MGLYELTRSAAKRCERSCGTSPRARRFWHRPVDGKPTEPEGEPVTLLTFSGDIRSTITEVLKKLDAVISGSTGETARALLARSLIADPRKRGGAYKGNRKVLDRLTTPVTLLNDRGLAYHLQECLAGRLHSFAFRDYNDDMRSASLAQHNDGSIPAAQSLEQIQNNFGLSEGELAELFGLTRQAVQQWRMRGVPNKRIADVDRIAELARVLKRRLIPTRLPQIVRTPAKGLQGRTVLETLAQFGVDRVYRYLEELYSYSSR